MTVPCVRCGGPVPPGEEGRMSGMCQRCLNGPYSPPVTAEYGGLARATAASWGFSAFWRVKAAWIGEKDDLRYVQTDDGLVHRVPRS